MIKHVLLEDLKEYNCDKILLCTKTYMCIVQSVARVKYLHTSSFTKSVTIGVGQLKAHFVVQSGSVVGWRQKNKEKKQKKEKENKD